MKVLIAVEDPEYAKAIADFVTSHGFREKTEFIVLGVVEPVKVGNILAILPGPILDTIRTEKINESEGVVKSTAQTIRNAYPKETVTETMIDGFAKEEIIKFARENKVDLIIVGAHGRSGINRLIIGSVCSAVVGHASCSVLVIRLPEAGGE